MGNSVITASSGWYLIQKGPQGNALVHPVACWEVRDAEVIGLVSAMEDNLDAEGRPVLSVPGGIGGRYVHTSQFNEEKLTRLQAAMMTPGEVRYDELVTSIDSGGGDIGNQ
ncbi:hypothetical protein [Phytohalomonas tamaricis]|uniref:hypothetical protein n=1 Tax=Phytohalomonas tamaricis TaxID=2081032 RepID=UPI000D0B24EB|nr:hypothetical protein [Phytohalomonas tamaricis]